MPGYLGNKSDMIAHHLAKMNPNCKIYDIKIGDKIYFSPDTPEQTEKEGFASCKYCVD